METIQSNTILESNDSTMEVSNVQVSKDVLNTDFSLVKVNDTEIVEDAYLDIKATFYQKDKEGREIVGKPFTVKLEASLEGKPTRYIFGTLFNRLFSEYLRAKSFGAKMFVSSLPVFLRLQSENVVIDSANELAIYHPKLKFNSTVNSHHKFSSLTYGYFAHLFNQKKVTDLVTMFGNMEREIKARKLELKVYHSSDEYKVIAAERLHAKQLKALNEAQKD